MPVGENTFPNGLRNFGSSHGATPLPPPAIQAFALATISPAGGYLVNEAHALGCRRAQLIALEQHLQGVAGLHQAGDALGAAGAGKQADFHFRQADPRLAGIRQHAVVAGQRQFECAAQSDAIDSDGERLAAGFQPAVEQRQRARALEEGLHRLVATVGLDHRLELAAQALQHGEIGAAGEIVFARGDDATLDRRVSGHGFDDLAEFHHHLQGDDVH